MRRVKKVFKWIFIVLIPILIIGYLIPQRFSMPVEGAGKADYHPKSFWYYPWGKSVVHKGVDVFAKKGTPLKASTSGLVLYAGDLSRGGKVVLFLGPKWRLHYYAHMDRVDVGNFSWVDRGEIVGTVGKSGNAANTPAHLHYSILTPIPYPWRIDSSKMGWKKMFYLNPIDYIEGK